MSKLLPIFCLFLYCFAEIFGEDVSNSTGWTFFKQSQSFYKLVTRELNFDEAEANCQSLSTHSHLASFGSRAEYDLLVELNKDVWHASWIGMTHNQSAKADVSPGMPNRFHLSFIDNSSVIDFAAMTVEEYGHYWGKGKDVRKGTGWQPSGTVYYDGSDRCIEIYGKHTTYNRDYAGKMNDCKCDWNLCSICQVKIQHKSRTEPTTSTSTTPILTTASPKKCLDGWRHLDETSSCYKFFSEALTFDKAEANCQSHSNDSHLASYDSESELDFLVDLIGNEGQAESHWVGVKHVWTDGRVECGSLIAGQSFDDKMNKGPCDEELPYLCKMSES